VDVAVTELRGNLRAWLDRVRQGEEIVVTDRGVPVARIVATDAAATLERLTADGVIARPGRSPRPIAGGRDRPRPLRPVAELVSEQRD
jgi:prevent-host-death family protein